MLALLIFLAWPQCSFAQSQQATVVENAALVYQEPDFDAAVVDTLSRGNVHAISTTKKGPFYKIRLKSGNLGWIADTDVRIGVIKIPTAKTEKSFDSPKDSSDKKQKPYLRSRYRGLAIDYVNYTEDTVGGEQSELRPFFGVKFYGPDTLLSGDIYIETNLLFSLSAPKYYAQRTQRSAVGFVTTANFLFQTAVPQSRNSMFFYGFGPMIKYSHFDLQLANGSSSRNYSADDLALGAIFNVGAGVRWRRVSARVDAKYYFEQKQYYGFGFSLGLDF